MSIYSHKNCISIQKKHEVVIIDPFPIFRGVLCKMIRKRIPYADITVAKDIDQASQVIKNRSPELVFLDIAMFTKNCPDYIQQIKEALPETVIVVLTTHDSAEHKAASFQHGADYFISKTETSGSRLIEIVEKTLSE
jgi:DNA-binding NarL/FixJ family response regulator